MATYQCDLCGVEEATTQISDMTTGTVKWFGTACLPLLGQMLISTMEPELLDPVLKDLGYQPTKATRDARKAAEAPEIDLHRTIAEVVEDQPRGEVETEQPARIDTATQPQTDLSTIIQMDEQVDLGPDYAYGSTAEPREQGATDENDPPPL